MAESASRPASPLRSLRRAALGALAAEVGHELQGPVNLFRLTQERIARGDTLDAEDLVLLDEELSRLSRLSGRLRELSRSSLELGLATPQELVASALTSVPFPTTPDALDLDLEPPSSVLVACDLELIAVALRELIDNALEARKLRAGVRFQTLPEAGFCVWDDGDGLQIELARAMTWGVSTRPKSAGIGLTLALRAARAHGFTLDLLRREARTEAWLLIPARSLREVGMASDP